MVVRELVARLGLNVDESAFKVADALIAGLKTGLGALVGGSAAVGAALLGAAKYAGDYADSIDEIAQKAGVSTDALQRLGYAGTYSSVGLQQLAAAGAYLAKKGAKDVEGELLRISATLSGMTDKSERSRYAWQKLGRYGKDLLPMLGNFAELQERLAEAEGFRLTPTQIDAGVKFSDALTEVQNAFSGVAKAIGAEIHPVLTPLLKDFAKWIRGNKEWLKLRVKQVVDGVAKGFALAGAAVKKLIPLLKTVALVVAAIWVQTKAVALWKAIAFGYAEILSTIRYLYMMRNVIWSTVVAQKAAALAAVRMWASWLWWIAVIVIALEDLWGFFTGKDSLTGRIIDFVKEKQNWVDLFNWITELAGRLFDFISEKMDVLRARLKTAIREAVTSAFPGGGELVKFWEWGTAPLSSHIGMTSGLFGGGVSSPSSPLNLPLAPMSPAGPSIGGFQATIEVNASPGMDTGDLANKTRDSFADWYNAKVAAAFAAASR